MFLKSHKQKICEVAEEVQKSVDLEFAKVNEKPEPGIALDQAGLKDGKEIITSFLESGETQLAIDHLLYMIKETNVRISTESYRKILETRNWKPEQVPDFLRNACSH